MRFLAPAPSWLSLAAGLVLRIYIVELQRGLTVDLHDYVSAGHCIVVHVGIEKSETAFAEGGHLVFMEFIAHTEFERPLDNGDVFP